MEENSYLNPFFCQFPLRSSEVVRNKPFSRGTLLLFPENSNPFLQMIFAQTADEF